MTRTRGQNTSTAVMQRRAEAHDSLDDFPTPPWATRALCDWLETVQGYPLGDLACREPAANRGHMAGPLGEYFGQVEASDIHDYGAGFPVRDFLFGPAPAPVDWTITNPPFRLAEQFIHRAVKTSRIGVAVILRTAFMEGQGRYDRLFRATPEAFVLPFTERVVMWKGILLDPDIPIRRWNVKKECYVIEKPTSASSYQWMIFLKDHTGMGRLDRIPPCRKRLTRPGDYPPLPDHLRPIADEAGALI